MNENLALFDGPAFTEFEEATAVQIAVSSGRLEPNHKDYAAAVERVRNWNRQREALNLTVW